MSRSDDEDDKRNDDDPTAEARLRGLAYLMAEPPGGGPGRDGQGADPHLCRGAPVGEGRDGDATDLRPLSRREGDPPGSAREAEGGGAEHHGAAARGGSIHIHRRVGAAPAGAAVRGRGLLSHAKFAKIITAEPKRVETI